LSVTDAVRRLTEYEAFLLRLSPKITGIGTPALVNAYLICKH